MKTNLLKLAAGLCFSVVTLTANAQVDAVENFDYPAGALAGLNGGTGWDGAWKKGIYAPEVDNDPANAQVVAGNTGVNTVGNHVEFKGGWTGGRHRLLANPVINEVGTSFWAGFIYQAEPDMQYGGFSFFNSDASDAEKGYVGRGDGNVISSNGSWPDNTFTGPSGDIFGSVSVLTPHYYLVHVTMFGDLKVRYDVWADYFGATAPMADFEEPTYQYTAWKNTVGSITQIRCAHATDNGKGSFDGVKLNTNYFQTIAPVPLDLISLTAKSTATGNLLSWDYASNDGVASISVSRKGDNGEFTVIKQGLPKDAKSFIDTNPLPGTNYYLLSSTDNDGTVKEYTNFIKSVKGFEVEPTFFPNPSTGGVVNVVAGNGAVKSVSIFDLTGKKVASKAGAGAVSTSSLAKGVYIIEITSDKSTTRNKLVVE